MRLSDSETNLIRKNGGELVRSVEPPNAQEDYVYFLEGKCPFVEEKKRGMNICELHQSPKQPEACRLNSRGGVHCLAIREQNPALVINTTEMDRMFQKRRKVR